MVERGKGNKVLYDSPIPVLHTIPDHYIKTRLIDSTQDWCSVDTNKDLDKYGQHH